MPAKGIGGRSGVTHIAKDGDKDDPIDALTLGQL